MTSKERHENRYLRRKAKREEKRKKYLKYNNYDWVFCYGHLYHSYKMSRRNVGWKSSTQAYTRKAPLKTYRTYCKLQTGYYRSRGFYEFNIIERGKLRHIRSVTIEERVVQRCLCDYCLVPLLSRTFIYDNGASTKNKGYHFARQRIVRFLRRHVRKYGTKGYVLLYDFSQFFDNIPHGLIKKIVRKSITDRRLLRQIDHFIDMFGDVGLGLGSQISQILALASANYLDHYIKERLRVKGYARYMDDGCLIHESKEFLQKCLKEIREICKKLGFKLSEHKTQIVKLAHGFTWLKTKFYIIDNQKIVKKITRGSVVKMRNKLKAFRELITKGYMTPYDAYMSFQSWRAYARKFHAYRTIVSMEHLFYNTFRFSSYEIAQWR